MPHAEWSGPRRFLLLLTVVALSAAAAAQSSTQPKSPASDKTQVVNLLGLEGVKHNAKGKLTVTAGGLDFQGTASHAQVATTSIEDVFTGEDSKQSGGKVLTVAKMGIPYGGGRALSLFTHEKFDTLTVEYRDENGGLHGALFTMPAGQASDIKKQLVAQGAKTSMPVDESAPKEKK